MNKRANCPNCGKPIIGAVCDYCGSVMYECINVVKFARNKLRIKTDRGLLVANAAYENVKIDVKKNYLPFWADNVRDEIQTTPDVYVDVRLHIKPDKKGRLYAIINKGGKNA